MGLYKGGLKSRINFALELEWAYVRVDFYASGYFILQFIFNVFQV